MAGIPGRHKAGRLTLTFGTYVIFQKDGCPLEVSVPAHRPIKAVYVTQLMALIEWSTP